MAGIIWLASYPKSGNTWVRIFIENLLSQSDQPHAINDPKQFTLAETSWHWYRQVTRRKVEDLTPDEISLLRRRVHKHLTGTSAGNVVVKTHSALMDRLGVPLITPEYTAGAIYLVRNPLDVAPSFASHFGYSIDRAIRRMKTPETRLGPSDILAYDWPGSWSFNVSSWTASAHPSLLVLRYEDLLSDTLANFTRIAQHLGHQPSAKKLAQAIEFSSFKHLQDQEAKEGFVEASHLADKFFRKGVAETWRETLSGPQIDRIRRAHKKVMVRFGYM